LAETILDIQANHNVTAIKKDNAREYALKYLNIDNVMETFTGNVLSNSVTPLQLT
jgi:hypothetical protein